LGSGRGVPHWSAHWSFAAPGAPALKFTRDASGYPAASCVEVLTKDTQSLRFVKGTGYLSATALHSSSGWGTGSPKKL
jgi:hypothetical protein